MIFKLQVCILTISIVQGKEINNEPLLLAEVLGKVYAVVARRRGRIISEDMNEGTTIFNIRTLIPVAESFGFAEGMVLVRVIM